MDKLTFKVLMKKIKNTVFRNEKCIIVPIMLSDEVNYEWRNFFLQETQNYKKQHGKCYLVSIPENHKLICIVIPENTPNIEEFDVLKGIIDDQKQVLEEIIEHISQTFDWQEDQEEAKQSKKEKIDSTLERLRELD
jgi:hypothetical protein